MCLPFAMEGANIMQIVKFVTVEKDKVMVWCTTNSIIIFRDFMQYVLDDMNHPEGMMLQQNSTRCEKERLKSA